MLTVLGGLAEFERELIRARTGECRAGKARGQKMGRPPKLTPHQKHEAIKRRRDTGNETLADIGRSYNVSAATFRDCLH
jgi:DNA invertase Pin-like site-specific DNA recombinase